MDRAAVEGWVRSYERLWRTEGTAGLAELFAPDAGYLPSPWAEPVRGLDAIATFWEAGRDGADESFDMTSDVMAVDGQVAVVRVSVDYGPPDRQRWRDLWVLALDDQGRCNSFEEWPFAPRQPDGHEGLG